jgi:hypothetical protein
LKLSRPLLLAVCVLVLVLSVKPVWGWSNGGYSANPSQPDYGTHDWIAQHALDYLPAQEKQYLTDNLANYLYGTELPDNSQTPGGIGDTTKHHIYYNADGTLKDDSAAQRANAEYQKALTYLKNKDYPDAAQTAGAMSHYIDDVAVFAHVMGSGTAWGAERNHSNYEDHVDGKTGTYNSAFTSYLHYDGSLTLVSASDAAKNIAYDTTFDHGGIYTCVWMDNNYSWNNAEFSSRCGESLDLAVNALADVLHTLYQESNPAPTPTLSLSPSPTITQTPTQTPTIPEFAVTQMSTLLMLTVLVTAIVYRKRVAKAAL